MEHTKYTVLIMRLLLENTDSPWSDRVSFVNDNHRLRSDRFRQWSP